MEEKNSEKREISIIVPPEIYTNIELSISEKLLLALDYSYNNKKGYTKLSNKWIGKLLNQHQNTVGKNRKLLIEKGYLEKDTTDKRKYTLLTEKLNTVELPLIKGKTDRRKLILPFEIYNHPILTDGAKLFWGDVNSFSENENGYYQQRKTAKIRFNVSEDSISNWTKELRTNGLIKEYKIEFDERTAVKFRKMKTKDLNDLDLLKAATNDIEKNTAKNIIERKPTIKRDEFYKNENECVILPLGAVHTSELYDVKQSENSVFNEDDFNKKEEDKKGVTKFSDLPIIKRGKKKTKDDFVDEDCDENYDNEDFDN
jgi:DNA-binding Lrp family transcriptional regulator